MYRVGGGNIGNTKILAGISRHSIEKKLYGAQLYTISIGDKKKKKTSKQCIG